MPTLESRRYSANRPPPLVIRPIDRVPSAPRQPSPASRPRSSLADNAP